MAKNITKTVIEDIAYELKNAGLWIEQSKRDEPEDEDVDYRDANVTLDSLIQCIEELLVRHDPTFDKELWSKQTEYRIQ